MPRSRTGNWSKVSLGTALTAVLVLLLIWIATKRSYGSIEAAVAAGVVDASLVEALQSGGADAIVSFRPGAAPATPAAAAVDALFTGEHARKQAALARLAESVQVLYDYRAMPLAFVHVATSAALLQLLNDPEVLGASMRGDYQLFLASSLPSIGKTTRAAWPTAGTGTSMAIIDSGIDYRLAEFGGCLQPGPACAVVFAGDFAGDDGQRDADGHGTIVASIAHAVAPGAKLLSLDASWGNGRFHPSDVLSAIDFVLLNRATYLIRAMNLSLGGGYNLQESTGRDPFAIAFARSRLLGILPVLAVGNGAMPGGVFMNGIAEPANALGAVRVAASYDSINQPMPDPACANDTKAPLQPVCFSQTGSLVTLWAPGVDVEAGPLGPGEGGFGTSLSAPHVTGAAAVLAWAKPAATADEIAAALTASGVSVTDSRVSITRPALEIGGSMRALRPVANDAVANAELLIGAAGMRQQLTIGATAGPEDPPIAGSVPAFASSVWFGWQAPLSGSVTFSTDGSDFNARVRAFEQTTGGLQAVAGALNSFNADGTERVLFTATAGTNYRIFVDGGTPLQNGELRLNWDMPASASRDSFSSALMLAGASGMVAGSNVGATKQPGEPTHCANDGGASVWFDWTAPAPGQARFALLAGSFNNACIAAYRGGSVGALTWIAGDAWNDPPPSNSRIASFTAVAGTTYYIVVDGLMCEDGPPVCVRPSSGPFTMQWTLTP